MIQTIEGIFRDGRVELFTKLDNVHEARVLVTFLPVDSGPNLTAEEVVELQGKLAAWAEDWHAAGMEAYDDYETRRRGPGQLPTQ